MIAKGDMMGVLLDACPSFSPQWEAFQKQWQEQRDDLPLYVALADFSRHLISMIEYGDTSQLPAVFAVVERLHLEGEHYVKEVTTLGILENLQNAGLHKRGTTPEQFRPYFGPITAKLWDKLYRFWDNKERLIDG